MFKRFTIDQAKKYGQGGYGATFAAHDSITGPAAVKVIDTRSMRPEAIRKECAILEGLDHPNVIKVLGHGTGKKSSGQSHLYFIFMELASGGELFDQVIDRGVNAMSEATARNFMRQLLAGVEHCHSRGVAHRDLKLENVLLTKEGVVKVIDFGLSHVYKKDGSAGGFDRSVPLREMCGSKSYAAPEVLGGHGYDGYLADVWSLGVCLFAMLSGFFPLDEASSNDWRFGKLMEQQQKGRSTVMSVYAWYKRSCAHLTPPVIKLLDGMLAINPAQRFTMQDVLTHPWTREGVASPDYAAMRGAADQGSFNVSAEVGDDEGPTYRGAFVVGPAVSNDMMEYEDDEPVYRSLGLEDHSQVPLPGLTKQKAFGGDIQSMWA